MPNRMEQGYSKRHMCRGGEDTPGNTDAVEREGIASEEFVNAMVRVGQLVQEKDEYKKALEMIELSAAHNAGIRVLARRALDKYKKG